MRGLLNSGVALTVKVCVQGGENRRSFDPATSAPGTLCTNQCAIMTSESGPAADIRAARFLCRIVGNKLQLWP
jgi:hypothetical protein